MKMKFKALQMLALSTMLPWAIASIAVEPPPNLQPLEEFEPPTISKDEQKPEITVIEKEGETVEEYRMNGQLYMIKVTPEHGVPYYMHKEDQDGGWLMDGPTQPLSVPKWTIFRF